MKKIKLQSCANILHFPIVNIVNKAELNIVGVIWKVCCTRVCGKYA